MHGPDQPDEEAQGPAEHVQEVAYDAAPELIE